MITDKLRAAMQRLTLISLVLIMVACASGPTVVSNSDPAADFASLKTFDFMQPLSTDSGGVQSLLSSQMIEATTAELEKRGMRRDMNNPDVWLNFLFETQETIRTRNTNVSANMHRSGRYGMWGGMASTPTIEQVTHGHLSIDLVDPARNQLIWEGTATNRLTDNVRRNQDAEVARAVTAIFAEFP